MCAGGQWKFQTMPTHCEIQFAASLQACLPSYLLLLSVHDPETGGVSLKATKGNPYLRKTENELVLLGWVTSHSLRVQSSI